MYSGSVSLLLSCLASTALASPFALQKRSSVEPYAPYTTTCPREPLVRVANSLSNGEKEYIREREPKAAKALHQWLIDTWGCEYIEEWDVPKLAIALSGGGPKAGLTTAGFVYAVDGRDSKTSVSGLLQSSLYISALSGGTLTLNGVMSNDFAEVSTLKSLLYDTNYQNPVSFVIFITALARLLPAQSTEPDGRSGLSGIVLPASTEHACCARVMSA